MGMKRYSGSYEPDTLGAHQGKRLLIEDIQTHQASILLRSVNAYLQNSPDLNNLLACLPPQLVG